MLFPGYRVRLDGSALFLPFIIDYSEVTGAYLSVNLTPARRKADSC